MKRVKAMFTLFQKLQESKTLAKKDRDKLRWVLAPVLNCYLIVEEIQDLHRVQIFLVFRFVIFSLSVVFFRGWLPLCTQKLLAVLWKASKCEKVKHWKATLGLLRVRAEQVAPTKCLAYFPIPNTPCATTRDKSPTLNQAPGEWSNNWRCAIGKIL